MKLTSAAMAAYLPSGGRLGDTGGRDEFMRGKARRRSRSFPRRPVCKPAPDIRICVRGYCGPTKVFEDWVRVPAKDDNFLGRLAEKHATAMASHELHMIEVEFLDEQDRSQRFFRFGSDPAGMVEPWAIPLHDTPAENAAAMLRVLTTKHGRPN